MAPQQIQWGTITLSLDNETFRKAFAHGRSMYFDDCEYDAPHVAAHMNTLDAAGSVLDEDGSGPVLSESPEEHIERHSRVVILPESTDTTRIAL